MRIIFFVFSLASLSFASSAPDLKLHKGIKPIAYDLKLGLDPNNPKYSGQVSIRLQVTGESNLFWLHAKDFEISEVRLSNNFQKLDTTHRLIKEKNLLEIKSSEPIKIGEATLVIKFTAKLGQDLSGLYQVSQGKHHYIYSQFEPLAARTAFPCFDEPGFKTPFHVTLTVPQKSHAISNSPILKTVQHKNGTKTVEFEPTPPLPTYLIAFAVGPFDIVPGHSIGKVPFRGIAPKGQGAKLKHALKETPKILKLLEDYFGIPYPYAKLDIIAVPDFAAGAMENPGAVTFRDSLLLIDPKTAPIWQLRYFAEVMAHELAHQ
ncbi:MAG: M1 family peptidase, partial [Deltaproteobacteria bacterium]|nr:M1 family peptidase [Deltaproteobacteria bacterium]